MMTPRHYTSNPFSVLVFLPIRPKRNLINKRFGRLLVLSFAFRKLTSKRYKYYWRVRCDCGITKAMRSDYFTQRLNPSCGCQRRSKAAQASTRHGLHRSRVYTIWASMLTRCRNPKHSAYSRYGKRGITVCKRWLTFETFFADMNHPPTLRHSLDRIDNSQGYSLANCRWATIEQQVRNTRSNVWLSFNGRRQIASDWAREVGVNPRTLVQRIHNKWTPAQVLGLEPHYDSRAMLITFKDQTLQLSQWAQRCGIKRATISMRLESGWTIGQALGFIDPPSRIGKHGISLTVNGISRPLTAWAKEFNIPANTVWQRVTKLKWSPDKALTTRVRIFANQNPLCKPWTS